MHVPLGNIGLAMNGSEVSQAIAMGDNNTMDCECLIYNGGTVNIQYEQSNDLSNWSPLGGAFAALAAPYQLLGPIAATADYVRINVTEPGIGTAVVQIGVNLSKQ